MEYFYIDDSKSQMGPLSVDLLVTQIKPETLIWCAGMPNWAPASTVPEVAQALSPIGAPAMPAAPQAINQGKDTGDPLYANCQFANAIPESERPETYKTPSIVMLVITILLCSPLGIVLSAIGLSKANTCEKAIFAGDAVEANCSSRSARKLMIASAIVTVLSVVITFVKVFMN